MTMSILHTSIKLSKHYAKLKFSVSCVINSLPHSGTITYTFIFIFLFFHSQVCITSTKTNEKKNPYTKYDSQTYLKRNTHNVWTLKIPTMEAYPD